MLFEGIEEKQRFCPMLGLDFINDVFNKKSTYLNRLKISNGIEVNVFVIGCGGTGGYLVPNIARLLSVRENENIKYKLILIDGDEVEYKNLARQNFIERDIGKNKAEVLAKRYSIGFNMNIDFIPSYLSPKCKEISDFIESEKELDVNITTESQTNIIISCVDNVATRFDIIKFIKNNSGYRISLIDSGNSEYNGQVILTENSKYPNFHDIFPDITKEKDHPNDLSCADHALSAPQNIATNMNAAQIAFNYFNTSLDNYITIINGLKNDDLYTDIINRLSAIDNNIVYFDSKNSVFQSNLEGDTIVHLCKEEKGKKEDLNKNSLFSAVESILEGIESEEEMLEERENAIEELDTLEEVLDREETLIDSTINIFEEE